jgi:hypothetical protein
VLTFPSMSTRSIELTSEADPILDSIAVDYFGDAGFALSELLLAHATSESPIDELETEHASELIRQRDLAVRDFAAGRGIPWAQVKLENGL